jgi:ribose transport system substrate-binding protein
MRSALVVVCLAVVVAVAGCGSTGSSTGGGSSDSGGGSFLSPATAKKLAAEVAEMEKRPTSIGITQKIEKPIPSGKVVDFVHCSVPACTGQVPFLEEAAEAVGWKAVSINSGLTAESIKNAWEQVIENEPDAVISDATPVSAYAPQLAKLKQLGIPVVNQFSSGDPTGANGIITPPIAGNDYFNTAGEALAKYVLDKSTEPPDVAIFLTSAYPNNTLMAEGFKAEMTKNCQECEVDLVQVPVTSIGTSALPQTISSYYQANPDVEWGYPAWNDLVSGLPAAMRSAGLGGKVKFVTLQAFGSPTANQYLEAGEELVAMTPVPGPDSQWRCIDELIRYFLDMPTAPDGNQTLQPWLITQESAKSEGLANEGGGGDYPLVKDYKAQFEELWGV